MKKTIEISTRGTFLSLRNSRLAIKREKELLGHIPFEDIGMLIIDSTGVTLSSGVLKALAESGGSLLACDDSHTPTGIFIPIAGNTLASERLRFQVNSTKPLHKNIWANVVKSKIRNQARVLLDAKESRFLSKLSTTIRSGDEDNKEARAAQYYWSRLFSGTVIGGGGKFRRHREGHSPNGLLNYGYSVLRAATARAICATGLQPGLGIHHSNRYNGFCLADDLMEPFRPFVDLIVLNLVKNGIIDLTKDTKHSLLGVLSSKVMMDGDQTILGMALEATASSLAKCFEMQVKEGQSAPKVAKTLKLPKFPSEPSCQ